MMVKLKPKKPHAVQLCRLNYRIFYNCIVIGMTNDHIVEKKKSSIILGWLSVKKYCLKEFGYL